MSDTSIPATSKPPANSPYRWTSFLGFAVLWIVLFVSMLKLPAPATSGLDPSWRMVIGHAVGRDFQWGTDLVFTYGPLGYLLASTNHGEHYNHFLFWQVFSNAIFATIIILFAARLRGWQRVFYYAYFIAFVGNYLDAMHITMSIVLCLAWLRESVVSRRWLTVLIGMLLALLSLVKFTNFMVAGFGAACVAGHYLWRRRWVDAVLTLGVFGISFIVGWALCGQNVLNIPAYIFTSLNASGGYQEGMAFYETRLVFWLGVTSAVSLGAYLVLSLWRRADLPRAIAGMLIVAAASFMSWKHGYIRADGHVFAHFIACLLVPVTFPMLLLDDGPLRGLKVGLLGVTVITSLVGTLVAVPTAITDAPAIWNYNLKGTINNLKIAKDLKRNADADFKNIAPPHFMPSVRSIVGDATLDLIGNEQAYVIFNGFNYRPRPAFQSYLPYTEKLMKLNEAFFRSERAPEYVLQKIDTIDHRLPSLEDSLSTKYIYYHYRFVLEEKTMLLWKRAEHDPALDERTLIETRMVGFDEAVAVPDRGDSPVWAEVVVKQSLLGKLRGFLYKSPILTMEVTDGGGFKNNYRLIRQMAGVGFFAYPHFTSVLNIQRYMNGEAAPRMQAFTVNVPAEHRKFFKDEIEVRFHQMKPMPRTKGIDTSAPDSVFKSFERAPVSTNALYPLTVQNNDGIDVLAAHPPSTLEFLIDFPATKAHGTFGLASGAYTAPNNTDGAEFFVDWMGADGKTRTLFNRQLQPTTVPGDRGMQKFEVDLPPGGGRMILRITPGPRGDIAFDWAYWGGVRFTPPAPKP